jgi:hypothetical protein
MIAVCVAAAQMMVTLTCVLSLHGLHLIGCYAAGMCTFGLLLVLLISVCLPGNALLCSRPHLVVMGLQHSVYYCRVLCFLARYPCSSCFKRHGKVSRCMARSADALQSAAYYLYAVACAQLEAVCCFVCKACSCL